MAIMHPTVLSEFRADLSAAQDEMRAGVTYKTSRTAANMWDLWLDFCASFPVDPEFAENEDPIPYLQVFAHRYRNGRIQPSGKSVRSGTVQSALRHVGQAYKSMGTRDIRLDATGNTDFRLARQIRCYTKQDPPPKRVKPIPIQVVHALVEAAHAQQPHDDAFDAITDMICIAFFFLMRPGEYTKTSDDTPFKMQDVKLFIGPVPLDPSTATNAQFEAVTAVSITFTDQKNGVKGEVITHGRTEHPRTCPTRAVVRRIKYLKSIQAPPETPLCAYFERNRMRFVNAKAVTAALRAGIILVGQDTVDIKPSEVEARSLRAGGATALLVAGVDTDHIQLLGRWKSDAMLRYLHIQADPVVRRYARDMFNGGRITFRPGTYVPTY